MSLSLLRVSPVVSALKPSGTDILFSVEQTSASGHLWGGISGTLSEQTDLYNELAAKYTKGDGTASAPALAGTTDTASGISFGGNTIYLGTQGLFKWMVDTVALKSYSSLGPYLTQDGSSDTVPTLCPRSNDINTGIGGASADELSLITGGVSRMMVTSSNVSTSADFAVGGHLNVDNGNIDMKGNDLKGLASCKIEMHSADAYRLTNPNNGHGVDIYADDITFYGGGLGTRKILTNAGDLEIAPVGDLLLSPAGGDIIIPEEGTIRIPTSGRSEILFNAWSTDIMWGIHSIAKFSNGFVFNNNGQDYDFKVGSQVNGSSLFMEASSGRVGIGTGTPATQLETTGALRVTYDGTSTYPSTAAIQVGDSELGLNGLGYDANNGVRIIAGGHVGHVFSTSRMAQGSYGGSGTKYSIKAIYPVGWTNTAGTHLELNAGRGSGSAAGGDIIFNSGAAGGSSGTSEGALAERMRLLGTGELGIGTDSPTFALEIDATAVGANHSALKVVSGHSATGTAVQIQTNNGNTEALTILGNGRIGINDATPGQQLEVNGICQMAGGSSIYFRNSGSQIYSANTNELGISCGGSQTMLFDGYNQVGIGTAVPGAKLNVVVNHGASTIIPALKISTTGGYGAEAGAAVDFGLDQASYGSWVAGRVAAPRTGSNYGGSLDFYTNDDSGQGAIVNRMRIDHDGNVGIGTTTPATALSVNGEITAGAISGTPTNAVNALDSLGIGNWSSAGVQQFQIGSSSGTGTYFDQRVAGDMIFRSSGNTERMRLLENGNFGINKASPAEKLHVDGNIQLDPAGRIQFYNGENYITESSGLYYNAQNGADHRFAHNGAVQMTIDGSSGNVGIGTVTPNYLLDVEGGSATARFHDPTATTGATRVLVKAGDADTLGSPAFKVENYLSNHFISMGGDDNGYELNLDNKIKFQGGQMVVESSGLIALTSGDANATRDVSLSRISANVLGVGTGALSEVDGTLRAGKVDIGGTGATSKLAVFDTVAGDNKVVAHFEGQGNGSSTDDGGQYVAITRTGPISQANGVMGGIIFGRGSATGSSSIIRNNYKYSSGRDLEFLTSADNSADPAMVMVIKGSGNIGIGDTSPSEKLSVNGDVGIGTQIKLDPSLTAPLIELDGYYYDIPYINFKSYNAAPSNTTEPISGYTTSGATTHHIQVKLNGVKAWIAVSTTAPTA